MSRQEITSVTVRLANGETRTFDGKGVLRDVSTTRKVEDQSGNITVEPSRFVTVALDLGKAP